MSQEDGHAEGGIDGLPIEEAASVVADRGDAADVDTAGRALSYVADDGVVRADEVDPALAHLSKVVSTPETRAELAAIELREAREAADPVADLNVVADRLSEFESRLDTVGDEVADLGTDLQSLLGDADERGDLYAVAEEIRRLTAAANRLQRAADELQVDVEEFRGWLRDPETRFGEFDAELDALESSLDALGERVDALEAEAAHGDESDEDAGGAAEWAELSLRYRAVAPLFADLRAELADLRRWADREGADAPRAPEVEARLDDLEAAWRADADRLEDLARPDWTDRYGSDLRAFEERLAAFDPPVDWGTVGTELERRLEALDEDG